MLAKYFPGTGNHHGSTCSFQNRAWPDCSRPVVQDKETVVQKQKYRTRKEKNSGILGKGCIVRQTYHRCLHIAAWNMDLHFRNYIFRHEVGRHNFGDHLQNGNVDYTEEDYNPGNRNWNTVFQSSVTKNLQENSPHFLAIYNITPAPIKKHSLPIRLPKQVCYFCQNS